MGEVIKDTLLAATSSNLLGTALLAPALRGLAPAFRLRNVRRRAAARLARQLHRHPRARLAPWHQGRDSQRDQRSRTRRRWPYRRDGNAAPHARNLGRKRIRTLFVDRRRHRQHFGYRPAARCKPRNNRRSALRRLRRSQLPRQSRLEPPPILRNACQREGAPHHLAAHCADVRRCVSSAGASRARRSLSYDLIASFGNDQRSTDCGAAVSRCEDRRL